MKISEVEDMLKNLKDMEGNIEVLGISINDTKITICYQDDDFTIKACKSDYKNCDVY